MDAGEMIGNLSSDPRLHTERRTQRTSPRPFEGRLKSGGATSASVAELQGLYGPFAFPELLLQKLWWRREYASAGAVTVDGRRVVVVSPGRWNRLGGPDFREAIFELGSEKLRGDVEVHLRAEDWDAHGHSADPAYANVRLHVVLFPPRQPFTRGVGGQAIPILVLLPLLWHDLEEYATDEAIAALLNRAEHRIATELAPLPPDNLARLLWVHGNQRWQEKVRFARRRVERLGWSAACHQTALEILGYRSNRAGMLRVASEWPLEQWVEGRADPDQLFEALRDQWTLQGVRPANHPRRRLQAYGLWVSKRPDWPEAVLTWARTLDAPPAASRPDTPGANAGTVRDLPEAGSASPCLAAERRRLRFPAEWETLRQVVNAGVIGPPRGDNVLVDGVLPLAAASGVANECTLHTWWWHGYPGNLPDPLHRALRELGWAGTSSTPAATGPAQGLLGWLLARESREAGVMPESPTRGA